MTELHLEGRLDESNFAKLMYTICRTGETGTLYLSRGKVKASVHIAKGQVTFASSNDPDDRLGELLVRHGQISYRQYVESADKIRPGKRLGTVLVELGYLNAQDLYHYVIEQVKEIIFTLFTWQEGAYRFELGPSSAKEIITLNISTTDLILEGIKRIHQWSRIQEAAGNLESVYALAPGWEERVKNVALTQGEQRLLDAVREQKTLGAILENTKYSDFEACRLLWAFQIIGLVNLRDAMEAEVGDLLGEALGGEKKEEKKEEKKKEAPAAAPAPVTPKAPPKAAPPVVEEAPEGDDDFKIEIEGEGGEDGGTGDDDAATYAAVEAAVHAVPASADPFPPKDVEAALARFNEKHAYLYALLKAEMQDGVSLFVDDAVGNLDRKHMRLFDGAKPDETGAFDKNVLMRNIKGNSIRDYKDGLDALIEVEIQAAQKVFKNPARMLVIKKGLARFDKTDEE